MKFVKVIRNVCLNFKKKAGVVVVVREHPLPSILYVKHSSVLRIHWATRQCFSVFRVWSTWETNTKYPIKQSFTPNCDKQYEGKLQCSLV